MLLWWPIIFGVFADIKIDRLRSLLCSLLWRSETECNIV